VDIAVIGSGIAGLTAARLLSDEHRVTIYERAPSIGMGTHTARVGAGDVDMPMRTFNRALWPNVVGFYEALGVGTRAVSYAGTFNDLERGVYFRYENRLVGGYSLHYVDGTPRMLWRGAQLLGQLLRFRVVAARDVRSGYARCRTAHAYLVERGFSADFIDRFFVPLFGIICTCSLAAVRQYPADILLRALLDLLRSESVQCVAEGTRDAVRQIVSGVFECRVDTGVSAITVGSQDATVVDSSGRRDRYDHVVCAVPANAAGTLLEGPELAAERALLTRFPYERSEVVVHSDPRLLPGSSWSPVTCTTAPDEPKPMATIWINAVEPRMAAAPSLFQTWNPLVAPEPSLEHARVGFERSHVTHDSADAVRLLRALQSQPGRRVWLAGAYAAPGIPLLDAGVRSAVFVTAKLGVSPPPWYRASLA